MRVLHVFQRIPWPLHDGGVVANYRMAQGLQAAGCSWRGLSVNTLKHYRPPEDLQQLGPGAAYTIDTRLRPGQVLRSLRPGAWPLQVSRFWSADFQTALLAACREFQPDVALLEGLQLCLYRPTLQAAGVRVVLRAHNVEHQLWRRKAERLQAALPTRLPKRQALLLVARQLEAYEKQEAQKLDGVLAISPEDAEWFGRWVPAARLGIAPSAVEVAAQAAAPADTPQLVFLGSLEWWPNQEGLRWFAREVWPRIRKQRPETVVWVGGRNGKPALLQELARAGLKPVGEIPDAQAFVRQHGVSILPLLSGSGMRVKLAEALGWGKPIVCTPAAAQGIPVRHEREVLLADSAESFADACLQLLAQPSLQAKLGEQARAFARRELGVESLGQQARRFLESVSTADLANR